MPASARFSAIATASECWWPSPRPIRPRRPEAGRHGTSPAPPAENRIERSSGQRKCQRRTAVARIAGDLFAHEGRRQVASGILDARELEFEDDQTIVRIGVEIEAAAGKSVADLADRAAIQPAKRGVFLRR